MGQRKIRRVLMIEAEHIREQAAKIRDVAQNIIDACDQGNAIDPYARNKVTGGSLAGDVAALAVMIVMYEQGLDD